MQQILEHIVSIANDLLWSKLLIVLLLSLGIYFTFRLKFLQVRMLKEMVRVLREGAASRSKNSISPFQAFCISMAARVGTGNITGIAIAIALGGPVQSSGCELSPLLDQHPALWKAHWLRFIK